VSGSQPRLIALAAAGAAAALGVIALAIGLVRACSSDAGAGSARRLQSQSAEGARVASAGMDAPGTAELRRLGCDPAMVLDMGKLLGDASAIRSGEPSYVVTCDVPGAQAPACERVAATYFGAVGVSPGGIVNIRVSRPGSSVPLCARRYAPSGMDLGT
jgi:hypothetical protein